MFRSTSTTVLVWADIDFDDSSTLRMTSCMSKSGDVAADPAVCEHECSKPGL